MRKKITNLFIVIVAILVIILCLVLVPYKSSNPLIIGGVLLIFAIVYAIVLAICLNNEEDLRKNLKEEFKYIFTEDAWIGWSLGLIIGSVLVGAVFLAFGAGKVFDLKDVNPSAFDIMGIYVGAILGVLAIRAFYKELHPIYELENLMKYLSKDLESLAKSIEEGKATPHPKVWFSFPGLNLGQFRVEAGLADTAEINIYNEVKGRLENLIGKTEVELVAIALEEADIKELYKCYGEMFTNLENSKKLIAIQRCGEDAAKLVCAIKNTATLNTNSRFVPRPKEFPAESFIIINDIVYTMDAWGFPIWKDNKFTSPYTNYVSSLKAREKLVSFIAYRRHNKSLAETIIERTSKFYDIH